MARVLAVDDDLTVLTLIRRYLRTAGHEVLIAMDGAQGVAMAGSEKPDLILMDLSLPVMSGWDATRQLKATEETRRIPVIALSAHAMEGARETALEAGCDDFDTKPVDLPRLMGKIQALTPGNG